MSSSSQDPNFTIMLKENPFATIRSETGQGNTVKSYQWYMKRIRELGLNKIKPRTALTSPIGELVSTVRWGDMYLFMYDPENKNKLPYYDMFPLVIPFRVVKGGFLGLNLHYLPPLLRMKLLGRLTKLADTPTLSDATRLRMTWNIIKNVGRFPEVRPCVKRYNLPFVRSRFLKINPEDWKAAILLPIETFQNATKTTVFQRSEEIIDG